MCSGLGHVGLSGSVFRCMRGRALDNMGLKVGTSMAKDGPEKPVG